MTHISITLENNEIVQRRIEDFTERTERDFKRIVNRTSRSVRDNARGSAPFFTHNLSNSIRVKDVSKLLRGTRDGLSKTITARGRKGNHLHLVELGTGPRFTIRAIGFRGRYRGSMPANPFMARAEQREMTSFNSEVRALLKKRHII